MHKLVFSIVLFFFSITNSKADNCDTIKNKDESVNKFLELHIDLVGGVFEKTIHPNVFGIWSWTTSGQPYIGRNIMKVNLSHVPTNATVNSANYYLYADPTSQLGSAGNPTFGSSNSSTARRISTSWDTSTINWTNYSTTTLGMSNLAQSINLAQDYIVDLTQMVQYWVQNPSQNYGVEFKHDAEGTTYNSMIFHSSISSNINKRPKLILCYSYPLSTQSLENDQVHFYNTNAQANSLEFLIGSVQDINSSLQIFDINGIIIYQSKLQLSTSPYTLRIDNLNLGSGIYIAQLKSSLSNKTIKFLLQ